MKSTRKLRSHSHLRSLVHSHRSLIRPLARSLRSSWERCFYLCVERVDFISFQPTVQSRLSPRAIVKVISREKEKSGANGGEHDEIAGEDEGARAPSDGFRVGEDDR